MSDIAQENRQIAARLTEYADLLEAQGEDGFRIRAYAAAAHELEAMPVPVRDHFQTGGTRALIALPAIGRGIAAAIAELLTTGHWQQLERLKGSLTPEALFGTVPGIGPALARRLADTLDVETLEDLETALRLGETPVPGIGPRRRQAILAALEQRLSRIRRDHGPEPAMAEPPVALLLDADALYRARAEAGGLRKIAPRRFNPRGHVWLPIMHARRGDWHLTALFSNTAQAHELDRTRDWVVIYYHENDGPAGRCTVVTERTGPLEGKRVIRGREDECRAHYCEVIAAGAKEPV